ncbi:MAG: cytochrome P450 [Thermoanaerobaculia bacterium]
MGRRVMSAPPGPRGHRLLGSLLDIRRDKLRFVSGAVREYGDLVCFRMGASRRLYLLNHPDFIRHVLQDNAGNYIKGSGLEQARLVLGEGILTSEGKLWAAQREHLQHLFIRRRLDLYADQIAQAGEEMIGNWREAARLGQPVDVGREAVRLALDVLGRTLLGTDLSGIEERLTPALDEVVRWSMRRMVAIVPSPLFAPTRGNLRCRRAVRELMAIVDEIVKRWMRAPREDGVLAVLLADGIWSNEESRRLLREELFSLLLAGHETTATALSWCCHLLARHPEVQRRMREEVLEALPGGRRPVAADLQRLPYSRMVLEETLRLYPSVWMITRRALADDEIGGYLVPAGSEILISVYTLHRHPSFWDAPEGFQPERFADERALARPSHAYLPFGNGPRACMGKGFASLEVILTMALIVRDFELSSVPDWSVEAEPLLTLRPRNGLLQRLSMHASVRPVPLGGAEGVPADFRGEGEE